MVLLKITEMKVFPLHCKRVDPRVAQMTTLNSVPNKCFRAKYIDTQIKCIFLDKRPVKLARTT